jgi:hypothetical protein
VPLWILAVGAGEAYLRRIVRTGTLEGVAVLEASLTRP